MTDSDSLPLPVANAVVASPRHTAARSAVAQQILDAGSAVGDQKISPASTNAARSTGLGGRRAANRADLRESTREDPSTRRSRHKNSGGSFARAHRSAYARRFPGCLDAVDTSVLTPGTAAAGRVGGSGTGQGRLLTGLRRLVACVEAVRNIAPQPLRWLLQSPGRMTVLVWMVALMMVGIARMSMADDIIVGPDLAQGSPKTLFETFSLWSYQLSELKLNSDHNGTFGIKGTGYFLAWILEGILVNVAVGLLYGGLTLLEWLLSLTVYRGSVSQIDIATRMIADHVFWPLIPATVGIAAFSAYARWRSDGRGFVGDLLWVIAAAALATGFALGPSTIMNPVDQARQDVTNGIIAGTTEYLNQTGNPVGFPSPAIGGDPQTAGTRTLVESLWSTFGATPWCYVEFGDLTICQHAGEHLLANDKQWQDWMTQFDNGDNPPVFGNKADYVRGQDYSRLSVTLMIFIVSIAFDIAILRLIFAGLTALVGFVLMLIVGVVFLAFWPIEGLPRRIGTGWWAQTFGKGLSSTIVVVSLAGVAVLSAIIGSQSGRYGFVVVAALNTAGMWETVRLYSWTESMFTGGGGRSLGLASLFITRVATRVITRGVVGAVGGSLGLVGRAARTTAAAAWPSPSGPMRFNRVFKGSGGLDNGPRRAWAQRMSEALAGGQSLPAGTPRTQGTINRAMPPRAVLEAPQVSDPQLRQNVAQAQQDVQRRRMEIRPPRGRGRVWVSQGIWSVSPSGEISRSEGRRLARLDIGPAAPAPNRRQPRPPRGT